MQIGFVLESARIDGTVRFVARQARGLKERGHAVKIACAKGPMFAALERTGASVEEFADLGSGEAIRDRRERTRLRQTFDGCAAVVAAAGAAFPSALDAGLESTLFLDLLSNDLFVGDDSRIYGAVQTAADRGRVFAHSYDDAVAHATKYGLRLGDMRLQPLPVSRDHGSARILRNEIAAEHETIILTAARLDADHVAYIKPLVDAVGRLRQEGLDLKLVIVGGGTFADELRAASAGFVTYLGFFADLEALYGLADVYVGEGSTRLEAALAGAAVVSSCAQSYPKYADRALFLYGLNQGTLHCYAPASLVPPTEFDRALGMLLHSPGLRETVARRGRQRVIDVHSLDAYVSWLIDYIEGADVVRCEELRADSVMRFVGDRPIELERLAHAAQAGINVGLVADRDVPWTEFAQINETYWDVAADAARRVACGGGKP